jgi:3-oxoacyl-[acyl-carrier protein] reductase
VSALDGKVAIVTGGSRGIGAAIARLLSQRGAAVLISGRDEDRLKAAVKALESEGRRVLGVAADAARREDAERLVEAAREHFSRLDVVVHNAGIIRDKKLANMDAERWSSVLEVNLVAPQRITDELLDQRTLRDGGRIIGVASIAGIAGNLGQTNYGTSKAGVIGFVQAIAPRAAARRITANAVAPGLIDTDMMARIPLPAREVARRMNSLSQAGQPVDVAETIAWYAHPGSGAVTGNVVRVCGQSLIGA